jgi:hypothetical protein
MIEDRRTLGHTKPCLECPFRIASPGGYLGGHPLKPYRQPPSIGMPTSCHCHDRGAHDPRTRFCAGSLAVIANDPGVTPLPLYAEAVQAVGERADCFGSVEDFAEHHQDADEWGLPTQILIDRIGQRIKLD